MKGTLYPRAATLGGCTAHNALVAVYPDRDDFDYVANLTGDVSWSADNMRNYFVKMEKNRYLTVDAVGHGYSGWLSIEEVPLTLAIKDLKLSQMILGAASALYNMVITNLVTTLIGDANSDAANRDSTPALYQIPITTSNGARNSVRDFLISVANENSNLNIRMNCLVTKVGFDTSVSPPQATGVSFLDGQSLYRADPRSTSAAPGVSGSATASREVIVAGGSYNSPQILKLSGIGPEAELKNLSIPVIKDLPGVGRNLQDHYEVTVQGQTTSNFSTLDGCTFEFTPGPDECLEEWEAGTIPITKGTYVSSGFAVGMFIKSTTAPDGNFDEFAFGGPVNFRGYFPGYSVNATLLHNWWSWALLKSHPRNTAGYVKLLSADPQDVPQIVFNYFDTGSGDYAADLETIYESIEIARKAFQDSGVPFVERLPGSEVQSQEEIETYIKNTAWGHHCSCTCPIGADDDPMAVLDSSFRVRGVSGLRVVDASVFPKIPGVFTMLSTYLVGEKAADVIMGQL